MTESSVAVPPTAKELACPISSPSRLGIRPRDRPAQTAAARCCSHASSPTASSPIGRPSSASSATLPKAPGLKRPTKKGRAVLMRGQSYFLGRGPWGTGVNLRATAASTPISVLGSLAGCPNAAKNVDPVPAGKPASRSMSRRVSSPAAIEEWPCDGSAVDKTAQDRWIAGSKARRGSGVRNRSSQPSCTMASSSLRSISANSSCAVDIMHPGVALCGCTTLVIGCPLETGNELKRQGKCDCPVC